MQGLRLWPILNVISVWSTGGTGDINLPQTVKTENTERVGGQF